MKSVVGAFFAAINLVYAAVFGGPIDGTAWDVKIKEDGLFRWSSRRETLVFLNGKILIAGEVARGYSPALYDAKAESGATAFSAFLDAEGRDPVEWSGRIEGDHISGVAVVRGRDGRPLRYVFTGERKAG